MRVRSPHWVPFPIPGGPRTKIMRGWAWLGDMVPRCVDADEEFEELVDGC